MPMEPPNAALVKDIAPRFLDALQRGYPLQSVTYERRLRGRPFRVP